MYRNMGDLFFGRKYIFMVPELSVIAIIESQTYYPCAPLEMISGVNTKEESRDTLLKSSFVKEPRCSERDFLFHSGFI